MIKRFLFGAFLGMAVTCFVIIISGGLPILYVDIASFILTVFAPFAAGFISHGPTAMGRSIALAFHGRDRDAGAAELRRAAACLNSLGRYVSLSALVGVLVGIIAILRDVSDLHKVGQNVAVCLISALYGALILLFFVRPLAARLEDLIVSAGASAR